MKRLIPILFLFLSAVACLAADRITLTVTITNTPADGNTLVVNSDTRTWKTSVATPSSQIAITNSIGGNATNLFNHVAAYPFSGLTLLRSGTNGIQLVGQVGATIAASMTGTWGTLTLSTQTVQVATAVRVPITAEPTASVQTNIASLIVSNVFNLGLSTNKILAASSVLDNFVDTSENQTVAGVKTFTGANVYSNANQIMYAGFLTNQVRLGYVKVGWQQTNNGIYFMRSSDDEVTYGIRADSSGRPSLYLVTVNGATRELLDASTPNFSPGAANLITREIGDYRFGQLAADNAWTATNTFTRITNSTIVNSTITNSTFYGNAGLLTNGTFFSPTLTNAINKGAAFQSYNGTDTTTLQLGLDAVASGANSVAVGQLATASAAEAVAVGKSATATHANAVAIGSGVTTAANEIRLGGGSQFIAAPNNGYLGGTFVIGHANTPTLPTGLAKGLYITNGTAASADPANGFAIWVDAGALQYRSSASSEGSGATHWVHNRAVETIGSGADYSLTTTYASIDLGGTDPDTTLPTAGTYHLIATIGLIAGGTGNDTYQFKLRNSTDAADVSNTETTVSNAAASTTQSVRIDKIVAVTGSKVIQIHAKNATAARGSIKAVETRLLAIRLY